MDFFQERSLAGKISHSTMKGRQDTYTYEFKPIVFNIGEPTEILQKGGFTPMVYKDGHRGKDNVIGLTDIGYFDIDVGDGVLMTDEDFDVLFNHGYALLLAKSKSGAVGKYRLIYRRPITIENMRVLSDFGDTGIILRTLESHAEMLLFIEYILKKEAEKLCEILPKVEPHLDKTSLKPHMHSSYIGQYLKYQNGACFGDTDFSDFEQYKAENYKTFEKHTVHIHGVSSHSDGKKPLYRGDRDSKGRWVWEARGNLFKTEYGMMTLTEMIASGRRPRLADVLTEDVPELRERIKTDDAFMPFIVAKNRKTIVFTSRGIHERNKDELLRVTFREDRSLNLETGVEMTIDNKKYLIDEKTQIYKEIK